jgi:hypothetical protein
MTVATESSIADHLRQTADYLRTHGWTQRRVHNVFTGACCLVGAVFEATGGSRAARLRVLLPLAIYAADTGMITARALAALPPGLALGDWNDVPGRTVDQVIGLLERAATHYEEHP